MKETQERGNAMLIYSVVEFSEYDDFAMGGENAISELFMYKETAQKRFEELKAERLTKAKEKYGDEDESFYEKVVRFQKHWIERGNPEQAAELLEDEEGYFFIGWHGFDGYGVRIEEIEIDERKPEEYL